MVLPLRVPLLPGPLLSGLLLVATAGALGLGVACTGPGGDPETAQPPAPLDPAGQQALADLRAAMATGEVGQVAAAARAASAWQGRDPELDTVLGDALANHLLRADEGAALLRSVDRPEDPEWRRAAADAALRAGDRAWLHELLHGEWALDNPVVDQVIDQARQDRSIDAVLLQQLLADCSLLDERPKLGRRYVDRPVPATLTDVLPILGADRVLVARTTLQRRAPAPGEQRWDCGSGWLGEAPRDRVPEPFPLRGVVVAAASGPDKVWLELSLRHDVPWATVASDAESSVRWIQAAELLAERRAAGDDEAQARAAVLARFGEGLVVARPVEEPGLPVNP